MSFSPFYFKNLKSIGYFVLISSIIFCFCKVEATGIIEKNKDTVTERHLSSSNEAKRFFIESVEPYFTNGMGFDSGKSASQAFKDECQGQYLDFGKNIDNYKQVVFYNEDDNHDPSAGQKYINIIKTSMKECGSSIFTEYTNLENEIDKGVEIVGFYSSDAIFYALRYTVSNESPQKVRNLKDFFSQWKQFREQCINSVRDEDNNSSFGESTFGPILEEIHNDCTQLKGKFKDKGSAVRAAFDEFVQTPKRCRQKSGCVAKLKKDVVLENLTQKEPNSFFGFISEDISATNNCCLVTYECKHVPDAKQGYDNILKSVGGSKNQNMCQSGSPERTGALRRFGDEIEKVCRESVKTCWNKVDMKLDEFRKEFLECFFLPDVSEQAYKLHKQNACNQRITEIGGVFEKSASQLLGTIGGAEVTLESFSQNLDDHPFIRRCEEPYISLQKDSELLKTRAEGLLFHTCNESDPNQNDQNQLAQGNQSGIPTIPMPHIRNTSGSPRSSSSRYSQNRPQEPPGNVGASPTAEVPYNQIYADPNSSKTDGGDSDSPPSPEGDPALFGPENQLTAAELEENLGKGNKDKKRRASETTSSRDTLSLSPDSSVSGFSPSSVTGQEGTGDVAKSDADSSDLGNDDGKGESDDSKQSEKLAQAEAGLRGLSSFGGGFSDSSYGGGYSRARRFMSRLGARIKKPLADAWKKAFGDSSKTVKDLFNVHGPEVNLLERQRELARDFCRLHKTCEGNFETKPLQ